MTLSHSISKLVRRVLPVVALSALVISMDGTWATAQPATTPSPRAAASRTAATAPAPAPAPGARATSARATSARATSTRAGAATAGASEPAGERRAPRAARKQVTGKLNLNTATEEQLTMLPTVGPSKAERVIAWRKKNGGFKRVADLRRVKGFGYKTLKRLEPFLDVTGETTLAVKR